MIPPDLDLAIPRLRPHRRLTPKVNQLPAEITLVLRHIRVQGRRQPRVVPRRRLCIVVHKIDSRRRRQPHLPPRRERPELRNRLRLQRRVLPVRAHHAYDRLPPRIHPRRRARVVVDVVRPPLGRIPLFPPRGQRTGPRGRRAAHTGHDGRRCPVGRCRGRSCGGRNGRWVAIDGVAGFEEIVGEDATGVLVTRGVCLALLCGVIVGLVGGGPVPGGAARVVIDVVRPPEGIDASFPPRRERTILIDVGVKICATHLIACGCCAGGSRASDRSGCG
jgi:hypothetical protein